MTLKKLQGETIKINEIPFYIYREKNFIPLLMPKFKRECLIFFFFKPNEQKFETFFFSFL